MHLSPDTTFSLALEEAYELAPLLRPNVEGLYDCAQRELGRFHPCVLRLSSDEGEQSELTGLLSTEHATSPGALLVLPDQADDRMDALLEKKFSAMAVPYDGNMRSMAVFALEDDQNEVAIAVQMSALRGLGDGPFILAVACKNQLRLRRITNQPPEDTGGLQGLDCSVQSYNPHNVYSQQELDEAARRERDGDEPDFWLVEEVMRKDKLDRLRDLQAARLEAMRRYVARRKGLNLSEVPPYRAPNPVAGLARPFECTRAGS
ncbi:hypothetical protein VAR608DRAFT_1555 [Variovorax sp. HW608]|uniref:hypothetical protein n=1 Tax=Variovorax sp. HW608 TaxID=1034889 RepID=UPI00081F88B7|nr:hypothetical protein [Variovorax sp. HW608]SCK20827.1 hypothetical protein VAR608DRAFT_1555 [Variovorax sp. HW608]